MDIEPSTQRTLEAFARQLANDPAYLTSCLEKASTHPSFAPLLPNHPHYPFLARSLHQHGIHLEDSLRRLPPPPPPARPPQPPAHDATGTFLTALSNSGVPVQRLDVIQFEDILAAVEKYGTTTCISDATHWISLRCSQPRHYALFMNVIQDRLPRFNPGHFLPQLHLIYLVNDLVHFMVHEQLDWAMEAIQPYLIDLLSFTYKAAGPVEEDREALMVIPRLWADRQFWDPDFTQDPRPGSYQRSPSPEHRPSGSTMPASYQRSFSSSLTKDSPTLCSSSREWHEPRRKGPNYWELPASFMLEVSKFNKPYAPIHPDDVLDWKPPPTRDRVFQALKDYERGLPKDYISSSGKASSSRYISDEEEEEEEEESRTSWVMDDGWDMGLLQSWYSRARDKKAFEDKHSRNRKYDADRWHGRMDDRHHRLYGSSSSSGPRASARSKPSGPVQFVKSGQAPPFSSSSRGDPINRIGNQDGEEEDAFESFRRQKAKTLGGKGRRWPPDGGA
ncbi:MAG: hypothetical protein DHS80DRAFT_31711 [Piptocephalis tieghemiana]|nr:MAG: hypothetical protein DHS80DRAFT_31711 [Piptocephalis tieghemiana]